MSRPRPDHREEPRDVRAARLLGAYDQLAAALETVDLEREPGLAEDLVRALEATDRACAADGRAGNERTARRRSEDDEEGVPPEATRTAPDGEPPRA